MGMASCHLRHQRMWRSHTTVLLDSVQEQRVLDDKPEPRRDDGGGLGSALDPASSDPQPELLLAYRQALWQSEA
jgi:hypothetical protein